MKTNKYNFELQDPFNENSTKSNLTENISSDNKINYLNTDFSKNKITPFDFNSDELNATNKIYNNQNKNKSAIQSFNGSVNFSHLSNPIENKQNFNIANKKSEAPINKGVFQNFFSNKDTLHIPKKASKIKNALEGDLDFSFLFNFDTKLGEWKYNANNINPMKMEKLEQKHDKFNCIKRGVLDIIKEHNFTRPIGDIYESINNIKRIKELKFPLKSKRHFFAAADIGLGVNDSKNLSSTADRFAKEYDKLYKDLDYAYSNEIQIKEGRNAIRHAIWQGVLTSKYGGKVAIDAGDAHETQPYTDIKKRSFYDKEEADMVTDLLNNKIGRLIGAKYPNSSRKDIALRILEEYWRSGLYSREKGKDGKWYVRKRMLPYEVFNELYHRYSNLNEYGK